MVHTLEGIMDGEPEVGTRRMAAASRRVARACGRAAPAQVLAALGVLIVGSATGCADPSPDTSVLPQFPADLTIVAERSAYNPHAGGTSSRTILVRSSDRHPDDVAAAVADVFDRDDEWRPIDPAERADIGERGLRWQWLPGCAEGEFTSVDVAVVEKGDVLEVLAGTETLQVDDDSVLIDVDVVYGEAATEWIDLSCSCPERPSATTAWRRRHVFRGRLVGSGHGSRGS
jgi:hypothetical protein